MNISFEENGIGPIGTWEFRESTEE